MKQILLKKPDDIIDFEKIKKHQNSLNLFFETKIKEMENKINLQSKIVSDVYQTKTDFLNTNNYILKKTDKIMEELLRVEKETKEEFKIIQENQFFENEENKENIIIEENINTIIPKEEGERKILIIEGKEEKKEKKEEKN